jgi:hypothetical protein
MAVFHAQQAADCFARSRYRSAVELSAAVSRVLSYRSVDRAERPE